MIPDIDRGSRDAHLQAPPSSAFPAYPVSWYFFGAAHELRSGPVCREVLGRRIVVFRTKSGRLAALDAHCAHMGSDLGSGCVIAEALQCPFHNWEFSADGRCVRIPAQKEIPAFARQHTFSVVERLGYVFVFNAAEALFALPFYDGLESSGMVCSQPAEAILECPWYLVGANAFDLQHFRAAHDRRLIGEPTIECPTPFARRATAVFAISGNSLQDRMTRAFALSISFESAHLGAE